MHYYWKRDPRRAAAVGLVAWMALLASIASPAFADDPAPPAEKPPASAPAADLDDALLKDLDNELLEGAGELRRPAPKMAEDKPGKNGAADDSAVTEGEDVGMPSEDQDPLLYISEQMRSAEKWMTERNRRTAAQQVQERVVEDLTRLIKQAEEQQQAQQQGGKSAKQQQQGSKRQSAQQSQPTSAGNPDKDSNQAAQDSSNRMGKAQQVRPDADQVRRLMKDTWGHLPERDREQVLQHSPEQFLPQYELMIERYYKRLAEEHRSR